MGWRLAGMSMAAVVVAWLVASALRSRRARGRTAGWGRAAAWTAALSLLRDEALRGLGAREHLWSGASTLAAILGAAALCLAIIVTERVKARSLGLGQPRRLARALFFGIGLGASLAFLFIELGLLRPFALTRIWLGPTGTLALIGAWSLAAALVFEQASKAGQSPPRGARSLTAAAILEAAGWLGLALLGPAPAAGVIALALVSAGGAAILRREGLAATVGFRAAILLTVLHAPL